MYLGGGEHKGDGHLIGLNYPMPFNENTHQVASWREGVEGEPAAAAMAMDPNDKEFLDNQDFYLDDSAFAE